MTHQKRPIIVIINLVLMSLAALGALSKLIDLKRHALFAQYFGSVWANFNYSMDIFMFLFSLALIFGFANAQKWAYKGLFWYYGVYFFGQILGIFFGMLYFDKVMEVSSILKYGEVIAIPISKELMLISAIVVISIQITIAFFILRSVNKNKEYFKY